MVDAIPFPRRGLMLVLSSPSGAGKSTLSRAVLAADENIEMSVSATTRPQRPGEVEGRDYFFKTPEQFDAMVAGDAFLEWAHVFGHRYGTPAAPVDAILARRHDVLFAIDWPRSEQRRVGKECDSPVRSPWAPCSQQNNN